MASFDTGVPALLIRADRNPFHHGTLGAVRSLGRTGIEVHAVVESATSPVCRSRYLHRAHPRPAGAAGGAPLLRTLRQVADTIGRQAVLIPMDDLSAIAVARLAAPLREHFLLPRQPPDLPERVADKAELAAVCRRLDIPHPETVLPRSPGDAADAALRLGLPVIAKWSRPWLLPPGAGLRSTGVLRTARQAALLFERGSGSGNRLLLQRLLPGGRGTDWFFHGYFANDGACLMGGAGRKDRCWPAGAGLTAAGHWLPDAELEATARRLAGELGYRGILDLDFRLDAASGRHHLLDFNPRPGAQFRLFTDPDGLDVVRALHLDLTGRAVPTARSVPGRRFVAENYLLLSALRGALGRRGPGPAERPPAAPSTECAWFAADDPLPFVAMGVASLVRAAKKAAPRLHRGDARPRHAPHASHRATPPRRNPAPGAAVARGAAVGPAASAAPARPLAPAPAEAAGGDPVPVLPPRPRAPSEQSGADSSSPTPAR